MNSSSYSNGESPISHFINIYMKLINKSYYSDINPKDFKKLFELRELHKKKLRKPIKITLEEDGEGFIAKTIDFPLFGYGDFPKEAISNLKYEIESLYEDLLKDDDFSKEWLEIKKALSEIIG
ncbi:MAG: hypothetical protein GXO76_07905 [Calditrichaeota bacterium]|nr:hypothetical protein [Calditrichota bacterium]